MTYEMGIPEDPLAGVPLQEPVAPDRSHLYDYPEDSVPLCPIETIDIGDGRIVEHEPMPEVGAEVSFYPRMTSERVTSRLEYAALALGGIATVAFGARELFTGEEIESLRTMVAGLIGGGLTAAGILGLFRAR